MIKDLKTLFIFLSRYRMNHNRFLPVGFLSFLLIKSNRISHWFLVSKRLFPAFYAPQGGTEKSTPQGGTEKSTPQGGTEKSPVYLG